MIIFLATYRNSVTVIIFLNKYVLIYYFRFLQYLTRCLENSAKIAIKVLNTYKSKVIESKLVRCNKTHCLKRMLPGFQGTYKCNKL